MASDIAVAGSRDYFVRDGKGFFYLGDTVWMTFANAAIEDWRQYLDWRIQQNFNVVQFSVLPIYHDSSESDQMSHPFQRDSCGRLDFGRMNEAYFDKARTIVRLGVEHGFVPCLGLLWCNYAPGSWAAKRMGNTTVMPFEAIRPYVEYVAKAFGEYSPLYFVSGDSGFDTEEEVRHYLEGLRVIKRAAPRALVSMHTTPGGDIPDVLVQSDLDFYMYQSGHGAASQTLAYQLAEKLLAKPVKRPIVNSEPCYEGAGRTPGGQGRWTACEVRRAAWQSLLSGAKAGVTYGGHGLWSWHRRGMRFLNDANSLQPLAWSDALRLAGAWDFAFARWVFETFDLFSVQPAQARLAGASPEARLAVSPDGSRFAAYAPHATDIEISLDIRAHQKTLVLLDERHVTRPRIDAGSEGARILAPASNTDMLVVGVA